MKRLLLIIALLALSFENLPAKQAAVRHPKVKQNVALRQWNALKARGIKTIRLTPAADGSQVKVHMAGIKSALENARINEKVSILLFVDNKRVAHLGSYSPDKKGGTGNIQFGQMPAAMNIKLPKNQKAPRQGSAELVFKNTRGDVVARIPTRILQGQTVWKNNTAIPR